VICAEDRIAPLQPLQLPLVDALSGEGEMRITGAGGTCGDGYLIVFFIHKLSNEALIVTAREMTDNEKRWYARKA
jgi:uncharacterized DUF497 family protein